MPEVTGLSRGGGGGGGGGESCLINLHGRSSDSVTGAYADVLQEP